MFLHSSGTTQGKPKYVLFNEELVHDTMQVYRVSYAFRNRYLLLLLKILFYKIKYVLKHYAAKN
jgi:GH3 auxin-responsive promoter